ncbi:hypothetical protein ACJX0J_026218, partial [Zea mays]
LQNKININKKIINHIIQDQDLVIIVLEDGMYKKTGWSHLTNGQRFFKEFYIWTAIFPTHMYKTHQQNMPLLQPKVA